MDFRVLGPLEVSVGGEPRALPGSGERALLVLLLLDPRRVVSADTLIDALWGEALPANPVNALQGRVSRLRRALLAAGLPETLVVARRPGYLVDVDPDEVDAHRFVRLVGEARRAVGQDSVAAARLYVEALGLWRGPALAEFSGEEWSQREAARLEELRLAATEEWIDLELAAGRHGEVVPALEALVAQHPLRERLHSQLMVALYRCGRQADALAVYQRLRDTLSEDLGLDPSIELRELEQAILRQDRRLAAPARDDSDVPTNLPERLTSFVGRGRELQQVRELVDARRLVTLTGPGGVGKTSLATELAAAVAGSFRDGVWLVKLAAVHDGRAVASIIADMVGAPRRDGAPEDQLTRYLKPRSVLILLDNCEHVADASAALAERLLAGCPRLRLLATSREPLAVPGEVQYALPPLDVPPRDATPDDVPAYASAALFADRARATLPGFELDHVTAPVVAQICRRLDGIPLAIELAAARVKTLTLPEIAAHLDDRFRFLVGGARTADARQQTLRATVEWSHQLLDEQERIVFRRLSVFSGGWTVQSAEQVTAGGGVDRGEILGLLARLVDRSLITADHGEGSTRFRMLETLRQYAEEQLVAAGEHERLKEAHAAYFTALAEEAEPALRGAQQGHWLHRLRLERDNVRAALTWCRQHASANPDLGLRLAAALSWFWYFTSDRDGRHELEATLAASPGASRPVRARALQALAVVARPGSCIVHPSPVCEAAAQESLEMLTELGDTAAAALSKALMAVAGVRGTGVAESLRLLAEADEEFGRRGDAWNSALVLFIHMELRFLLGAEQEATRHAEQALALFRALGDHWGISAVQYHHGLALHRAGRLDAALRVYEQALAEGQFGLTNTVQYALANLGHVALLLGDTERAERHFGEAHVVARRLGAEGSPLGALGQGHLGREHDDIASARARYTEALHLLDRRATPEWAAAALTGLGFVAELTGDLQDAESHHRAALHDALDAGAAGAGPAAAAVEGLACVAAARGDGEGAASLLGAAARWRERWRRPATRLENKDILRASRRAQELLGKDAYCAAYTAAPAGLGVELAEASDVEPIAAAP